MNMDDLTDEQSNAMRAARVEARVDPLWEAEARRRFPDQPHLGRFDGIVSNDMVETLIFARREAFEWGARWEWERAYCEALDSSEAG